MAGFGGAALPLISCIALLAGAILIILGFATPSWAFNGKDYVGLWRYGNCLKSDYRECYHYDQPSFTLVPTWLHVVRAFECASVICVSLPLVILPVYMYIALGIYYKCIMGWMSLLSILSAIFGVVGVIIYAVNLNDLDWDMGWSLIVVVVGCAMVFIGFMVLVVALVTKRPESIKETLYPTTLYVDPDRNVLYTISAEDS